MVTLYNLRFVTIILLSSTSISLSQKRQIDPEVERKINDFINNVYLPSAKVSTLALTIVQNDGQVLYTNGYGWANEEKKIRNTNETLFIIGSVTKSVTALTLIKSLHEKFPELGEAVLDTPIRKLLPEFNFTLVDRFRSEHGTIRDLLAHRMCVRQTDWIYYADAIESTAEIAYRQRYSEEMCGMRSEFQYHNQIYVLAGEILSYISGKPFAETVEDFLKELGMEKSRFVRRNDDFVNTPEIARPYFVDTDNGTLIPVRPELPIRATTLTAAGGLLSSANDMEKYLRLHMNFGNLDGKQIVAEEVIKWMRRPVALTRDDFDGFAYGQGLIISEHDGWEYIKHGGDIAPYHSLLSLFPAQNLSIFTSTNQGPLRIDRKVLHSFIFDTLRGAADAEEKAKKACDKWLSKEETKKKNREKAYEIFLKENVSSHIKRKAGELVGKYGSGAAGDAEITEKWNNETSEMGLYLKYGKWSTGWLEPAGQNFYKIIFDTEILRDFYEVVSNFFLRVDEDVIEFVGIVNGEQVSFGKFRLGVTLDKLPPVPWPSDSCRAR